jgi:hypothetical protein
MEGSSEYNNWYAPVLIVRYSPAEKLSIAAKAEYYQDEQGVIISTGTPNGFQTFGYSLNVDYQVSDNVLWRLEGRGFSSEGEIFLTGDELSTGNYFVTTALAISFQ